MGGFIIGGILGLVVGGCLGVMIMAVMIAGSTQQYQLHRKGDL